MGASTPHRTESERLFALSRAALLDTPPEPAFDDIIRLTADLTGMPMAAIHLLDADRQWAKAQIGLGRRDVPRAASICDHVVLGGTRLEVRDTLADRRFAANPLVTGPPGLRFYAGEPISFEGIPIGALCVLDTVPHPEGLTRQQSFALHTLAGRVTTEIALRHAHSALATALGSPAPVESGGLSPRPRGHAPPPAGANDATDYAATVLAEEKALLAAQQSLVHGPATEDEVWQSVADAALHVVRAAEGAGVAVPAGEMLICRAVAGSIPPGARFRRDTSLSGRALIEDRALITNDGWEDPRTNIQANRRLGIRSGIAVPIRRHGKAVGVLRLLSSAPYAFTERDLTLAQILVGIVGNGLSLLGEARARQAAQESDARQRLMADAVPQIIWQADNEGKLDFLNRRFTELTGVEGKDALFEQRWVDMLHPDDREAALAAWAEAQHHGHEFRTTCRQRMRNGEYRWMLVIGLPYRDPASGRIQRWFGSLLDVHDEHEAQKTISELNAELARQVAERTQERDQIWNSSTDMLCVATLDGNLVALNPAWEQTLGWSLPELVGRPYLHFVHPDDEAITAAAAAGLARGEPQLNFINRYRHKDGSYRWLSWNATPSEGRIYAIARDITAEKEREENRLQLEEQLRQAQKMEAVGQLTGGLAHDFNNLLTGIIGSLDLLETRIRANRLDDLDRFLLAARGAADRAAALTHRLLAFARRQTLDPRPTRLDHLARGMEELVRRSVGPGIKLQVESAGDLWSTLCDPNQLENALLNLCINARDAMPQGGRLRIGTANLQLEGRAARLVNLPPGPYVVMRVSDTGTGMPPEVVARAFDPFFTTKPIGQGTGLGLSMVYGFARQSGGEVRIESAPGQGTTISLYLPRHKEGEAKAAPAPLPEAAPATTAGGTVLVVDDEPTVHMLAQEVLGESGITVLEATEAGAAFSLLQSGRRVDVLVTDIGLPGGMNGRQLADAARVILPELKVVFITGYAEEAAFRDGNLGRGMEVLAKPFSMEALAARIRRLLNG